MKFKALLAAGFAALAIAGLAGSAEANYKVGIGFGYGFQSNDCDWIGHQYHCFGPHFGPGQGFYGRPDYGYDDEPPSRFSHRIACDEAKYMVRERGYHKIKTKDCHGKTYSFTAVKRGHRYLLKVNAFTGRMKAYEI